MSASASDASRRRLAEAADVLAEFRGAAGLSTPPETPSSAWRVPAEASVRAALEEALSRVRFLEGELAEAARERDALLEKNHRQAEELKGAAAAAAAAEALRVRAAEAEARAAEQKARATLMEAEYVRLESMRRKAERGAADAEAAGRMVEEAVRRELRTAHAALDRAASESGALEARAKTEHEALRLRLESAVSRLQTLEREKRIELARGSGDAQAAQAELQRAQAVAAALRLELAATETAQLEVKNAQAAAEALRRKLVEAERKEDELHRELSTTSHALAYARAALARRGSEPPETEVARPVEPVASDELWEEDPGSPSSAAGEGVELPGFIQPPIDAVLDPGWARLLRLIRPPVEAAYVQLRRLSATALTPGQKALLRMGAASIAQATDSLSSVELALEEGPASVAAAPALPALEAGVAAWEAAFRRQGVSLAREWPAPIPDAAYDAKPLRVMLNHVLRNVLEAVPRGGRLAVRAWRGPDGGLRVEFVDDGPGFSKEWLERRFEPFAAPRRGRAGLGLSLVRRTLRRWGGDAEAANGPSGRGARLTMIFAPPPPRPAR